MKIIRYLSQATGISRRKAEKEVKSGKVSINGKVAEFWQEVKKADIVKYNKKIIKLPKNPTIVILNKPKGYLTARYDPKGRKTVMDLLPKKFRHLKPIGRLDKESEGLLVLTDAGQKIFELTHPKFEKEKEYVLQLKDPVSENLVRKFKKGIKLREGLAKADKIKKLKRNEILVVLHQGYKRQLRRMVKECGNEVVKLVRTKMGSFKLGDLKSGKWKVLDKL